MDRPMDRLADYSIDRLPKNEYNVFWRVASENVLWGLFSKTKIIYYSPTLLYGQYI